jgi:RhoGAP domain/Regulator of G protein signaling domain
MTVNNKPPYNPPYDLPKLPEKKPSKEIIEIPQEIAAEQKKSPKVTKDKSPQISEGSKKVSEVFKKVGEETIPEEKTPKFHKISEGRKEHSEIFKKLGKDIEKLANDIKRSVLALFKKSPKINTSLEVKPTEVTATKKIDHDTQLASVNTLLKFLEDHNYTAVEGVFRLSCNKDVVDKVIVMITKGEDFTDYLEHLDKQHDKVIVAAVILKTVLRENLIVNKNDVVNKLFLLSDENTTEDKWKILKEIKEQFSESQLKILDKIIQCCIKVDKNKIINHMPLSNLVKLMWPNLIETEGMERFHTEGKSTDLAYMAGGIAAKALEEATIFLFKNWSFDSQQSLNENEQWNSMEKQMANLFENLESGGVISSVETTRAQESSQAIVVPPKASISKDYLNKYEAIVRNPQHYQYLQMYARKTLTTENIDFIKKVDDFKLQAILNPNSDSLKELANNIQKQYILESTADQINLPDSIVKDYKKQPNGAIGEDYFDDPKNHVLQMFFTSHYPDFLTFVKEQEKLDKKISDPMGVRFLQRSIDGNIKENREYFNLLPAVRMESKDMTDSEKSRIEERMNGIQKKIGSNVGILGALNINEKLDVNLLNALFKLLGNRHEILDELRNNHLLQFINPDALTEATIKYLDPGDLTDLNVECIEKLVKNPQWFDLNNMQDKAKVLFLVKLSLPQKEIGNYFNKYTSQHQVQKSEHDAIDRQLGHVFEVFDHYIDAHLEGQKREDYKKFIRSVGERGMEGLVLEKSTINQLKFDQIDRLFGQGFGHVFEIPLRESKKEKQEANIFLQKAGIYCGEGSPHTFASKLESGEKIKTPADRLIEHLQINGILSANDQKKEERVLRGLQLGIWRDIQKKLGEKVGNQIEYSQGDDDTRQVSFKNQNILVVERNLVVKDEAGKLIQKLHVKMEVDLSDDSDSKISYSEI